MATDLFLEMAELPALPATGSLGTGQLDTCDLLVTGVPISISSKYLYLYLELSGSTMDAYSKSYVSDASPLMYSDCSSFSIKFYFVCGMPWIYMYQRGVILNSCRIRHGV